MMRSNHCSIVSPTGWAILFASLFTLLSASQASSADRLQLLFMGDNGHHQPARRFQELAPAMESVGIDLRYTDRMSDLNAENLGKYDGLVLYANIDTIDDAQAKAVLDYVRGGGGFVPLHCATYCWRNNPQIVALMGGQFKQHGGQVFSVEPAQADHPIMQGFAGFTSWDETYVHHLHNETDRTVLEYRRAGQQAPGNEREPWTWIRTYGDGRVFYTAWGHDQRTFTNPGFQNLVERGIRWACGDDPQKAQAYTEPGRFEVPEMTPPRTDVAPFEFVDVGPEIPNYTPGREWGKQGEPQNMMQKPLAVDESIKHFVTPRGMAVRRYADERDFQSKPIAMTWDQRGRLWICETLDYPNELGKDRDRIRICEDTDGDHVADKFTVFAQGLSIPTSIVIVRGGAVVQNGTQTLYMKDTDGDDVCDQTTTLISNWSLGDTHGGVSNFRYGLDNWIWAMQGYNNSKPEFDGDQSQSFRQGFWRFKLSQTDPPHVTDLEFVRSTDNNTWGLGISEEGLIFGSTANHNPSVFMPIANRYYERVRGWAPSRLGTIADSHMFHPITENIRQVDHHGGYTAGAGHALYTARAFPQPWWNQTAFVAGPTGHLVGTFVLKPEGANFTSTSPLNLLASDDQWSAPIMAEVGPDGAVWVIDWYNYIVQHNPTPHGFETGKGAAYESKLRDKKHGRIYRVVATGKQGDQLHEFTNLDSLDNGQLIATLSHPSARWRLQAQRLLIERQADDVTQPLLALIGDPSVDSIGLNVGAIHALQTLAGLGQLDAQSDWHNNDAITQALRTALTHRSAGVRRNALAVLPQDQAGAELLLANDSLLRDADMQVRLQAVLALSDMPSSDQAGQLVAERLTEQSDPIMIEAFTSAAATHARPFLTRVVSNPAAADNAASLAVTTRIAEHLARGRPEVEAIEALLLALQSSAPPVAHALLGGITNGLPRDYQLEQSKTLDEAFVAAFSKVDASLKVKVIGLAQQCGTDALQSHVAKMFDELVSVVADEKASSQQRTAAANDLIAFQADNQQAVADVVKQISPQTSPELASGFFRAISQSKAPEAGQVIVDALPALTPTLKATAMSTLLSKAAWTRALLSAVQQHKLDLNELSLDQKQALRAYPDKEVQALAEKVMATDGGLPDANREKVLQSLMHVTQATGDVDAGREVFKKVCAACHKHGQIGQVVGPDLTGMAVHPKAELLTHIIDPSRSVEGNFRMYNILTFDGQVINGMLAGESRTSVTIIDSQAKKIDVAREDIDELVASRKSVMPEGFEKQIDEKQMTDLLEFLTNKGKYLPISLDRYATAISTRGLFGDGDQGPDRMIFPDWKPKTLHGVPFVLTDPQGKTKPNLILLHGPNGTLPPKMPRSVSLPCNTAAKSIHMLSGVGGWSFPFDRNETVSMIVRLHYDDGSSEDHELVNGVHFADYIRRVDVPQSEFAFALGGQQIRYLSITPKRSDTPITTIELVKGPDRSAPMVMAVTIER